MAQREDFLLGLDVGSTTAKVVVLDAALLLHHEDRARTYGRPLETALALLRAIPSHLGTGPWAVLATTGTAGGLLAEILGGRFVNEIVAHTAAARHYHPEARTVLDMGGQDTKLVQLVPGPNGRHEISDFSVNTLCAAGTGSFLDQQAHRLGLSVDDLGGLALQSENPARIAGRCTVFAKSDMIHLQQGAVPTGDIVAGLCLSLVRNLKATLARGKRLLPPMILQGGVAANLGVRKALQTVLQLSEDELVVPLHYRSMGAIGAVLEARSDTNPPSPFRGVEALETYLGHRPSGVRRLPALARPRGRARAAGGEGVHADAPGGRPLYLGIDVGSVSTKMVLVAAGGRIVARYYGPTAGTPLCAIQKGLAEISGQAAIPHRIAAVGATGSGRYLAGDFVGADTLVNEITAQARASAAVDPLCDTIFEIGGQDSKFIRLKEGTVVDFMMNRACAAGTGSFLEEQASRLGVPLVEFGPLALRAKAPVRMGERCTVFMESDLVHYLQQGVPTPDLVAGLCYAIVHNYLNKVVEARPLGRNIFFQGATALNAGVVAAFEAVLGRSIAVPPDCDLTGALGAALLAEGRSSGKSRFRGFDLAKVPYEVRTFECEACPNQCAISRVHVSDRPPLFYGGRCERYERRAGGKGASLPDLVGERETLLRASVCTSLEEALERPRGAIGIPVALFYQEWLPFFARLLSDLGFGPVASGPTTKALVRRGVEAVVSEPCFPVKVAHGHVEALLAQGLKRIFLPALIDMPSPSGYRPGQACPYVQSLPYTLPAAMDLDAYGAELLRLPLRLGRPKGIDRATVRRLAHILGVGARAVARALDAARESQQAFNETLLRRGDGLLSGMGPEERAVVLVGRPYNALDPGGNLGLHQKLRGLGVLALPMDFLPLDAHMAEVPEAHAMYWRYGQKILAAGALIRKDPRLHALYVTNFGCGPDSFLLHFFRESQQDKPFLEIEIDEHSADAGALTRLEAFLDTLEANGRRRPGGLETDRVDTQTHGLRGNHGSSPPPSLSPVVGRPNGERGPRRGGGLTTGASGPPRTLYIPPMCDHAHALAAAVVACGGSAEVLPPTDEESVALGLRCTSGKECYPAILTTGDMAKMAQQPAFDPQRAAFFMPGGAGPCRFGQYHRLHRRVLDNLGYADVPIYSPSQDITLYSELGIIGRGFSRLGWRGVVSVDLLDRLFRAVRPYAKDLQSVDRLYRHYLGLICNAVSARLPLEPVLLRARAAVREIPVTMERPRIVVGIVGEIYTRANPKANGFLVQELEALGVEVRLPSVSEWILYVNFTARRRARRARAWREHLRLSLENWIQIRDARRLEAAVGPLPGGCEPLTKDLLRWASPYVSDEFEGETVLSVGKAASYLKQGVSGLINVLPFTCMPGNIVTALLTRVRAINGARPFLALACDGQQETGRRLRLEAFVHQVRNYSPGLRPVALEG